MLTRPVLRQSARNGLTLVWFVPTYRDGVWETSVHLESADGSIAKARQVRGRTSWDVLLGGARIAAYNVSDDRSASVADPGWHVRMRSRDGEVQLGPVARMQDGFDMDGGPDWTAWALGLSEAHGVGPVDAMVNACRGLVHSVHHGLPLSFAAETFRSVTKMLSSRPSARTFQTSVCEAFALTEAHRRGCVRELSASIGEPTQTPHGVELDCLLEGRVQGAMVGRDGWDALTRVAEALELALGDPGVVRHVPLAPWPPPAEPCRELRPWIAGAVESALGGAEVLVYLPRREQWKAGAGWVTWASVRGELIPSTGAGPVSAVLSAVQRTSRAILTFQAPGQGST